MVTAITAVCLLALGSFVAGADAQSAPASVVSSQDIVLRDQLVNSQESLLNAYRCLFDVDTQIVPSGCLDGAPQEPAGPVPAFSGTPSIRELLNRDKLIASQESLLNVYRCLFDVDTQIVPSGCLAGKPRQTSTVQSQRNAYAFSAVAPGAWHTCAIHIDRTTEFQNIACWGNERDLQIYPPVGQYTHIASGRQHSCAIRDDSTIACWGHNGFGQANAPQGQYIGIVTGDPVFGPCFVGLIPGGWEDVMCQDMWNG